MPSLYSAIRIFFLPGSVKTALSYLAVLITHCCINNYSLGKKSANVCDNININVNKITSPMISDKVNIIVSYLINH